MGIFDSLVQRRARTPAPAQSPAPEQPVPTVVKAGGHFPAEIRQGMADDVKGALLARYAERAAYVQANPETVAIAQEFDRLLRGQ